MPFKIAEIITQIDNTKDIDSETCIILNNVKIKLLSVRDQIKKYHNTKDLQTINEYKENINYVRSNLILLFHKDFSEKEPEPLEKLCYNALIMLTAISPLNHHNEAKKILDPKTKKEIAPGNEVYLSTGYIHDINALVKPTFIDSFNNFINPLTNIKFRRLDQEYIKAIVAEKKIQIPSRSHHIPRPIINVESPTTSYISQYSTILERYLQNALPENPTPIFMSAPVPSVRDTIRQILTPSLIQRMQNNYSQSTRQHNWESDPLARRLVEQHIRPSMGNQTIQIVLSSYLHPLQAQLEIPQIDENRIQGQSVSGILSTPTTTSNEELLRFYSIELPTRVVAEAFSFIGQNIITNFSGRMQNNHSRSTLRRNNNLLASIFRSILQDPRFRSFIAELNSHDVDQCLQLLEQDYDQETFSNLCNRLEAQLKTLEDNVRRLVTIPHSKNNPTQEQTAAYEENTCASQQTNSHETNTSNQQQALIPVNNERQIIPYQNPFQFFSAVPSQQTSIENSASNDEEIENDDNEDTSSECHMS